MGQSEEHREQLKLWLDDYFYKALDWVIERVSFYAMIVCHNKNAEKQKPAELDYE